MEEIAKQFVDLKHDYDDGDSPTTSLKEISAYCIGKLDKSTTPISYGNTDGKDYFVFTSKGFNSRPIVKSLFIRDQSEFEALWDEFIKSIDSKNCTTDLDCLTIDKVIYSAIMSFSSCYDLWKPASRKTPGTLFEILLGSITAKFLPAYNRKKFISLPNTGESVSTDIVFDLNKEGIVIPAKITTRERIVQPFAHQKILDSVFGYNRYKSILMCVSETQRDDKNIRVNNICVPGTIKLFQKHLSELAGIFYLDPPGRYIQSDITDLINVGNYSYFFKTELAKYTVRK